MAGDYGIGQHRLQKISIMAESAFGQCRSKLLSVLHTHTHHGITGTLRWSYKEGHLTARALAESLPDMQGSTAFDGTGVGGEEKVLEEAKGDAFAPRHLLVPTSSPLRDQEARGDPTAVMLARISFLSQTISLPLYSHYSILSIYKGKLPCLT